MEDTPAQLPAFVQAVYETIKATKACTRRCEVLKGSGAELSDTQKECLGK